MQARRLVTMIPRIAFTNAPLDAQLIITRRCNLSCGYCAEYDNVSQPVPLGELTHRIDALHRLGAANITLLGGEPLMHPDVAEIVAHAGRKSNVSLVTNGFLLRNGLIESLNQAGLNNLTVSIDTLSADPTRFIQKSFQSLKTRLERLRRLARFDVHITAVLCDSSRDEFRQLMQEMEPLGFRMSVNLLHNAKGYVTIGGEPYVGLYEDFYRNGKPFTYLDYDYGKKLLEGDRPDWKCRAGARYMYVDEDGLVQLCASQMGRLAKPLIEYTASDLREQSQTYKGCEEGCSVGCAFRCSLVDNDKPAFLKAVLKGYLRGNMFNNGRKRPAVPPLAVEPAVSDE